MPEENILKCVICPCLGYSDAPQHVRGPGPGLEETENIGFMSGPPKNFPSFEDFPSSRPYDAPPSGPYNSPHGM